MCNFEKDGDVKMTLYELSNQYENSANLLKQKIISIREAGISDDQTKARLNLLVIEYYQAIKISSQLKHYYKPRESVKYGQNIV